MVHIKNGIYIAFICFVAIPTYAQNSTAHSEANIDVISQPAKDYGNQIDGLLRDIDARLRKISERVEAGELTERQAQTMKLAATRAMIARLETISAVYDARARSTMRAQNTVSVQELERRDK